MASLSKVPSSTKPKLERRNALKGAEYEPSETPRSAGAPSSCKPLDKGFSKSFRILGLDSDEEIDKLCEFLGLDGGADAFSIPVDAWEAGRKSGFLDRSIGNQLNRPPGSLFVQHGRESMVGGLARSPLASNANPIPLYNSMTSSSGYSMASDSSLSAGERGFLGPKESGPVIGEVRPREDRQQAGNVIQQAHDFGVHRTGHRDYHKKTGFFVPEPPVFETWLQSNQQTRSGSTNSLRQDQASRDVQYLVDHKGTDKASHNVSTPETQRPDNRQTGSKMERVPRLVVPAILSTSETSRQVLLPPPGSRSKSYFPDLSTQELLVSFGPDESEAGDHHGAASGNPEDNGPEVEFGFVSEVVQQLGTLDRQQSIVEHARSTAPSTPEYRPDLVNIQSWKKLDMLGSGSFGTVYEGLSEDGMYFAVKEVSLSENDSKAQQCVSQLEQEIKFLSKFQHENIVRYLGAQKEPDKLYIFLELVTKGSLSSLYTKHTLFESQVRSYTRQILSGLEYLHEQKVMHRDIKCANILVDVSGKIKVADFGLAKQISQLDELKSCQGTAYWMAPEVIDPRQTYSFPADIWSLGCTVLEMQTRRPPFGDMEWARAFWKVGHGEAPPIPDHLSEDCKDFLNMCLQVNPSNRPSARNLLEHPFVRNAGTGLTPRNSL